MEKKELKELLGDAICEYCPFTTGDIDKKCNSQCDGRYCNTALEEYLNEDSNDIFEETLGIIETTDDDLDEILRNNTDKPRYSIVKSVAVPKTYPKFYVEKQIDDAKEWCKKCLEKGQQENAKASLYDLDSIEYHLYRVGDILYIHAYTKKIKQTSHAGI